MKKILVLFVITLMIVVASHVSAESIDNIRILKISPQDGKAVVKTNDRKLKMIKVGDVLGADSELLVKEIADGRVVFEKKTDKGTETLIVRVENGKQRVERVRKMMDKQPLVSNPHVETIKLGNGLKSGNNGYYSMTTNMFEAVKDSSKEKVNNKKDSTKNESTE